MITVTHGPKEVTARPCYIVLSDIDGTAVDETLPERDRLPASAQPATAAFKRFASELKLTTGLCTARAAAEALSYGEALGAVSAPIIAEDGGVILLPREWGSVEFLAMQLGDVEGIRQMRSMHGRVAVLTSDDPMGRIKRVLDEFDPNSVWTSSLSAPERLLDSKSIGYQSLKAAELACGRLASAFVELSDEKLKQRLVELAQAEGLRVFGLTHLPHLIPSDVSKGRALQILRDIYRAHAAKDLKPIVFGNNENDLPMFAAAHQMGGIGVIVEHPDGGFMVETDPYVVKATGAFGNGIASSFDTIATLVNKGD